MADTNGQDAPSFLRRVEQWTRGRPADEIDRFVAELFDRYLAAGDHERRALRQAVWQNRHLWNVVGEDDICAYLGRLAREPGDGPVRHLRGWLFAVALAGGCGDWRDTIVVLDGIRQDLEARGIPTRTHFEQIAATADAGNTHGISGMSTRNLILSAGGLIWFEGEVIEKEELYRRFAADRPAAGVAVPGETGETDPVAARRVRSGRGIDGNRSNRRSVVLRYAVIFLVLALVAALFGFGGIAGEAAGIAKILLFVFLILMVISFVLGRRGPSTGL